MTPRPRPPAIVLPPYPEGDEYGALLFVRLRTERRTWPVRKAATVGVNTLGMSGYVRADDRDETGKHPEPWIPAICEDIQRNESEIAGPVYVLRALTAI